MAQAFAPSSARSSAPAFAQPSAPSSAPSSAPAFDQTEVERFTLPAQEVPRDLWLSGSTAPVPVRPITKHRPPLKLAIALPSVILLAMMSAFFSWVSAEPLWLAVGHGQTGTATVTRCVGDGLTQRCIGDLEGTRVTLLGVTDTSAKVGAKVEVRRVSEASHRAYAGEVFLRWFIGLALVFACGIGIALVTGVRRLADRRERRAALGTSLAAPLLVTIGFLAATF